MQRIRIRMCPGWDGLYRFDGPSLSGWPRRVEVYQRSPECRKSLGRWVDCPNINVAQRIAKTVGWVK